MGAEAVDAEYAVGRTLDPAQVPAALARKEAPAGQGRVAEEPDTARSGTAVTVRFPAWTSGLTC